MKTFQKRPNAEHFTYEKIKCKYCDKKQSWCLEVYGDLFCFNCFVNKAAFIFSDREFILVRGITHVKKKAKSGKN